MVQTGDIETRLASRSMLLRVVGSVLFLLIAGETTVKADCGGYVVMFGGARFRQSHGRPNYGAVDANRRVALHAQSRHAGPLSRTPCSSGECQGRTQDPYSPPPIILAHSRSGGDALSGAATPAANESTAMRLSLAAFHWIERYPSDDIFKPPR